LVGPDLLSDRGPEIGEGWPVDRHRGAAGRERRLLLAELEEEHLRDVLLRFDEASEQRHEDIVVRARLDEPDLEARDVGVLRLAAEDGEPGAAVLHRRERSDRRLHEGGGGDRKSTRLNSSHVKISYAVFCLKKKK